MLSRIIDRCIEVSNVCWDMWGCWDSYSCGTCAIHVCISWFASNGPALGFVFLWHMCYPCLYLMVRKQWPSSGMSPMSVLTQQELWTPGRHTSKEEQPFVHCIFSRVGYLRCLRDYCQGTMRCIPSRVVPQRGFFLCGWAILVEGVCVAASACKRSE
jgi:hypothetical protein